MSKTDYIYLDGLSSTSSPGCSEIPMQIIKNSKNKLLPIFVELFNECLQKDAIPSEWKFAMVTPLYKGKGLKDDCNNYRGSFSSDF